MKFYLSCLLSLLMITASYSQNHLLISEIQVSPSSQEFVEIFNPNPSTVSLDSYYISDYNTYYEMVTGQYTSETSDFLVKFPDGSQIDSAGVLVVVLDGSSFSGNADFEIRSTSTIADMTPLYVGSTAGLSNAELVILFSWDGQADLVSDVDYAMWGDVTSNFIDKSGVTIDGPDPDTTPSSYLDDTPVSSQNPFAVAPISGKSMGRISVSETGENFFNGNGISGHDETSEPVAQNFILLDAPSPGSTSLQIPSGNGSGTARVVPDSVRTDSTVSLQFTLKGTVSETVTDLSLTVPASWSWTGSSGDVQLGGGGLSSATFSINGDMIEISAAAVTLQDSAVVSLNNLVSPSQPEQSVFEMRTAVSGGTPALISESPSVTVFKPLGITPIADIQANPGAFTTVTVQGIVVIGAGITTTGWTDTYVQDNSGSGINIYQASVIDPALVRGNEVLITGTVDEFNGVTEIVDYTISVLSTGNTLPDPRILSTQEATDTALEGVFVEVAGEVTDFAQNIGGGTNIRLNDGSGECLIRVWDTAGINFTGVAVGEQLVVRGVLDIYQGATQLLLGYQEDLTIVQGQPGDGSGTATVSPDTVAQNQAGLTLDFTITGENPYSLESVSLTIPSDWQWNGNTGDVSLSGAGFAGSQFTISGRTIAITQASVSSAASGTITVSNLTSPDQNVISSFAVKTAVAGGTLSPIGTSPSVTVGEGAAVTPIADIQANPSGYTTVTVDAIVVVGAGKTATGWTDTYVQDNSGAGINVYQGGSLDSRLVRGNRVVITGTVEEFNGVTEIIDYTLTVLSSGNALPDPLSITTQEANSVSLEGTFIEVSGEVTDFAQDIGGGSNIRIDDGSGECLVRVWNSTGVNLSAVAVGEQLIIRGPLDIYQGATQLLLAYQEDLSVVQGQQGDGSGTATVTPDTVETNQSGILLEFSILGAGAYTLESVSLSIPSDWQWSGSQADVTLSGSGFNGSQLTVTGKTVTVTQSGITSGAGGQITIQNLTSPNENKNSIFVIKTAVTGGVLTSISLNPSVTVGQGVSVTAIADIQQNTGQYTGQTVTVEGIVTLGAGITTTGWTDSYIQDNSGYGINVYQGGTVDSRISRGNRVRVTGVVDEYLGTTEIVDYTLQIISQNNPLPDPLTLTTSEATDTRWEGVYVQVSGVIGSISSAGGGTNINVNDGSGSCTLRIWDTAGLNVNAFGVGDTITARGVMDIFSGAGQILIGYQEDIFKPGGSLAGDGSGFAVLDRDSVGLGVQNLSVSMSLWGTEQDTIRTVHLVMPGGWGWTALAEDVSLSGSGLANARKQVVSEFGEITVELTDCFITATDTGIVAFQKLTSPLESVISYFWVKTAVEGGVPQFINTSPLLFVGDNPMLQIRDLQINSAQFRSPVTVRGVVTVGAGVLRTDRTSAYIQDESEYGINISRSGTPDQRYQRGFYVEVTGAVSEYQQTTQLTPSSVTILDSSAQLPDVIPVSTGEANSPRWDGTYIRVPRSIGQDYAVIIDKYTTSTQPPFDYNIVVNDGTGPLTLRVWGTTGINVDSLLLNEAVIASGVGSVFISNGEPSYQILPAYQPDLLPDTGYEPTLQGVDLDIPPYPFVPDRGETISIRYNAGAVNNQVTVRIFDLGGRMITTLVDKRAELVVESVEWDGRDKLLDFVPLGTYICHLEVMEFESGKKETRMAPIVIGTMLKK